MVPDMEVAGRQVRLRALSVDDCNDSYLSWMRDPEVNRYMETRWCEQTLESIKAFVEGVNASSHSCIFAIEFNGLHIGNIKIGPINARYRNADLSYFIGDKSLYGKGLATDAVSCAIRFAFGQLGLHRLQAGCFGENIGSQKVLKANGFKLEGTFRQKYYLTHDDDGDLKADWTVCYEYALLKCEWQAG